jgi:hypothetical protein
MSEGLHKWSEVSDEEANQYRRDPARGLATPAAALVAVGCLGIAANIVLAVILNAIRHDPGAPERSSGTGGETSEAYKRGQAAAPLFDCCLIAIPTLAVYPLVIIGGIRMRQFKNRGLAMLGAILAMAPCSAVILLGLPIGIWSLIVLADPAVRAEFAGGRPAR